MRLAFSMVMNILMAVDSSEVSEAVLQAVLDQFSHRDHEVRVLQAVDWEAHLPMSTQFALGHQAAGHVLAERDRMLDEARAYVEGLATRLRASGFSVSTETPAEGAPAAAILEAAERWPADLILVGSHGRSAVNRLILGSVSSHVVHHAECSVEVVRPKR